MFCVHMLRRLEAVGPKGRNQLEAGREELGYIFTSDLGLLIWL